MHYYNENDPKAAAWLRQLIIAGLIPQGYVDERSILDVKADDLAGYVSCHFFAGIGGWAYALRSAGWPDTRPVWTGSCPCQPFSVAGKGLGEEDERHLWPEFRQLITDYRKQIGPIPDIFGEQVASADGRNWLAGVRSDLEALGYDSGGCDLCSAGAGEDGEGWIVRSDQEDWERIILSSPNIRQRLYWMAYTPIIRGGSGLCDYEQRDERRIVASNNSGTCNIRMDYATSNGTKCSDASKSICNGEKDGLFRKASPHDNSRMVDPKQLGLEGHAGNGDDGNQSGRLCEESDGSITAPSGTCNGGNGIHQQRSNFGFWADSALVPCIDGKARRIEPGTFPLAHGVPGRVGLLRGYGNGINPILAAEFILACEEAKKLVK